jgi:hypothetical protein
VNETAKRIIELMGEDSHFAVRLEKGSWHVYASNGQCMCDARGDTFEEAVEGAYQDLRRKMSEQRAYEIILGRLKESDDIEADALAMVAALA